MSQSAYHFFLASAGYSYNPKTETPMQGRIRCAQMLAHHERRAREAGCSFEWTIDPDSTSADWTDDDSPWQAWQCVARDSEGAIFASLHGIDFGHDGEPWGDPYRRVVEAELAGELPLGADE